jgi:hypothetical protein
LYRGGGDAFITKLSPSGNELVYSTYHGGSGVERGYGIAVDNLGNAYVTGHTNSTVGSGTLSFPIAAAFQPQNGGNYDAFVSKLNAAGSALMYSTFLGGDASEYSIYGGAIAVDTAGNAYVAGSTASPNFPRASFSPIQPTNGGGFVDGFVVKFNATGTALVYSTYLGGTGVDIGYDVALDDGSNAYIAGWTNSLNFPTVQPLQAVHHGSGDAFISALNSAGSALVYSTYWVARTGGSSPTASPSTASATSSSPARPIQTISRPPVRFSRHTPVTPRVPTPSCSRSRRNR